MVWNNHAFVPATYILNAIPRNPNNQISHNATLKENRIRQSERLEKSANFIKPTTFNDFPDSHFTQVWPTKRGRANSHVDGYVGSA